MFSSCEWYDVVFTFLNRSVKRLKKKMFCCLRNCFDGIGFTANQIPKKEPNPITLDTTHMGNHHFFAEKFFK